LFAREQLSACAVWIPDKARAIRAGGRHLAQARSTNERVDHFGFPSRFRGLGR
jgi:hypothetical protein